MGSLMVGAEFQHILRLLNTNVDGKHKVMYAMTAIRGIGRRFSNVVCKKAEVDMKKRAGACVSVMAGGGVGGQRERCVVSKQQQGLDGDEMMGCSLYRQGVRGMGGWRCQEVRGGGLDKHCLYGAGERGGTGYQAHKGSQPG
jgi:hypothetical protein